MDNYKLERERERERERSKTELAGCSTLRRRRSALHWSSAVEGGGGGNMMPIPVAARPKAWVFGGSLAGIVGSNPPRGMNVCVW
jgi:hypothetical protein